MHRYCYQFIFISNLYVYLMFDYFFVICVAVCKNKNPRKLHRYYRQRMRAFGRRQLIRSRMIFFFFCGTLLNIGSDRNRFRITAAYANDLRQNDL